MNLTSQFSENFLKFKDEKYATISGMSSQIKIHFILKTLLLFPIPTNTINYFPHKFVTHVIFSNDDDNIWDYSSFSSEIESFIINW